MLIIFTVILVLLLLIDWVQTRFIAKHPELFSEINIILGVHPSVKAVNLYFSLCIVAVAVLGQVLPEIVAVVGCTALIGLEAFITIRNYRYGVKMK